MLKKITQKIVAEELELAQFRPNFFTQQGMKLRYKCWRCQHEFEGHEPVNAGMTPGRKMVLLCTPCCEELDLPMDEKFTRFGKLKGEA